MHIDEASGLCSECVSRKVSKNKSILKIALSRKQKHPNCKFFENYFQIDEKSINRFTKG